MTNPQRKTLEEVLPCGMLAACSSDGHDYRCPAHYRPAVEAWAAETEAQFNHLLETERKVWQSRQSERYRQVLLERASKAERSLEKMEARIAGERAAAGEAPIRELIEVCKQDGEHFVTLELLEAMTANGALARLLAEKERETLERAAQHRLVRRSTAGATISECACGAQPDTCDIAAWWEHHIRALASPVTDEPQKP